MGFPDYFCTSRYLSPSCFCFDRNGPIRVIAALLGASFFLVFKIIDQELALNITTGMSFFYLLV
jgi:hypothetical protein